MIAPTVERVEISEGDRKLALDVLLEAYTLPDGTELISHRQVRRYAEQIKAGYYMRLVWPITTSPAEAWAWAEHIVEVFKWHKLGIV